MGSSLRLVCAAAVGVLCATPLPAQRTTPSTYAITNARLVPVSGPAIARGTIVVRNGLIAAIGANVPVPADARVIDGEGLTVYPGLIDAFSTFGLPAPTGGGGGGFGGGGGGGGGQAAAAGGPNSNYPSGIRPENRAVDQIKPNAEAFTSAHGAGITAALTAPGNGVMRGQSALINLAGDDPLHLVVKSPVAQHIGFNGAGGGYPGSLMGVITSIRQLFIDAQRYRDLQAAYAKNPRGMRRPDLDPSLEAVLPALARQQPVVMAANTQREIERALDIAKEFNLQLIIAGGSEAHLVADRLKAENVPVLLSTNFPRRTAAPAAGADPDPIRLLRQRAEAPTVPAKLQAAGVRFAFQSGGISNWSEWLGNARRAVDNGLSARPGAARHDPRLGGDPRRRRSPRLAGAGQDREPDRDAGRPLRGRQPRHPGLRGWQPASPSRRHLLRARAGAVPGERNLDARRRLRRPGRGRDLHAPTGGETLVGFSGQLRSGEIGLDGSSRMAASGSPPS